MTVINDLDAALQTYPETNVQLNLEEVEFPGDALNVNEEGSFRVRITNNGSLNLTDVTLKSRASTVGSSRAAGRQILSSGTN
jgi:hypothetical protein